MRVFLIPVRINILTTHDHATYTDTYFTCTSAPCAVPNVMVAASNRLPGVPTSNAFAALSWGRDLGWRATVSGQYLNDVAVNDINSVFAPSYAVFGVDDGYTTELRSFKVSAFLRINNFLDRHYVGSVIVNDSSSRYIEPGPGLNILAGFTIAVR